MLPFIKHKGNLFLWFCRGCSLYRFPHIVCTKIVIKKQAAVFYRLPAFMCIYAFYGILILQDISVWQHTRQTAR